MEAKVPYKVACLTWLVLREVILTHDYLRYRGFQLCSRCYLCGKNAEIFSHLFLYCKVTGHLWDLFYQPQRYQVGNAKNNLRSLDKMEHREQMQHKQRQMENCLSNNLVVKMEGKELKVFWKYKQPLAKNQK